MVVTVLKLHYPEIRTEKADLSKPHRSEVIQEDHTPPRFLADLVWSIDQFECLMQMLPFKLLHFRKLIGFLMAVFTFILINTNVTKTSFGKIPRKESMKKKWQGLKNGLHYGRFSENFVHFQNKNFVRLPKEDCFCRGKVEGDLLNRKCCVTWNQN